MLKVQRLGAAWLLGVLACAATAWAQGLDLEGRPVAEVRVSGVKQVDPQLVLNQVHLKAGDAYTAQAVDEDIQNITRLGRFSSVRVAVKQREDGALVVTYVVTESPLLADVQVVGNKVKNDQELLGLVLLRAGETRDDFLIKRGITQIEKAYKDAGYFRVSVSVDDKALEENDTLSFRVREGPQIKVREVAFVGNAVFTDKQLSSQIGTKKAVLILEKGAISEEQLVLDVAKLREFYLERGYLDVRVGREIRLTEDSKSARVEFRINEGSQYTVGAMTFQVKGHGVFSEGQLREAIPLQDGAVYSRVKLLKSRRALLNLYGKLGYLPDDRSGENVKKGLTDVRIDRVLHGETAKVDVIVTIIEGKRYRVGDVVISGNPRTQDRVVRRALRGVEPGRYYDVAGLDRSVQQVQRSRLFQEAKITIQGDPEDETRDALLEVREGRTGSVSIGASIGSDAGVVGALDYQQRNFDITDTPESLSEFLSGNAFRGAGQTFSISLAPGDEVSTYSVSWSEPRLFDSDYFLSLRGRSFDREREDYDEGRVGAFVTFGKRFGDVWSASVRGRYEAIDISSIDADAPIDVFNVGDDSDIAALALTVSRSTVDNRIFPTRGTRVVAGFEQAGALGGDYDFSKATAEFQAFFTVDEDFFERKTVLSIKSEIGYIFPDGESPLFERFYAGGHRSFRGFEFRGVGPRGLTSGPDLTFGTADDVVGDDPVGGDFVFLLGTEYNFPIWQEVLRGVLFVDSGTVQDDFAFDQYRVAVGAGIRLNVPFLGQAPFAFDFAVPLIKEPGDEERVFSFSLALPF